MDIKQIKYDLLIQNNLKEDETHFAIIDGKKSLTLNDFMNKRVPREKMKTNKTKQVNQIEVIKVEGK